jgi:putative FmdB family regulatory protein
MPIYEYVCSACSSKLEIIQKVSDPAPESCPSCGAKETMGRQVSRTSFQLKGGGWYADLYSSVPKKSESSSESSSGSASEG